MALMILPGAPSFGQGKGKNPPCDNLKVSLSVRDAGSGDSVTNDGLGPYPATLNCDNDTNHLYMLNDRNSGRGFVFNLTDPVNPDEGFTLTTQDPVPVSLGVRICDPVSTTCEVTEGVNILAMAVGTSAITDKLQFNFGFNDKTYWLSWGASYSGTSTATVTRTASDAWVIETSASPNNVARLRECPPKRSKDPCVDRLYRAPIRIELQANP
jgi:hypothetical protein